MTDSEKPPGKFDNWLKNAKATNLRTWLTVREVDQLITQYPMITLYAILQMPGGRRAMTLNVQGIDTRIVDSNGEVDTLILDVGLRYDTGEEKVIPINIGMFVPPSDQPMRTLSRVFGNANPSVARVQRDNYLEDLNFIEATYMELVDDTQRRGGEFFRRFLGGPGEPA